MAKKKKRRREREISRETAGGTEPSQAPEGEKISMLQGQPVGKYIFAVGLLVMFGGYIFLAKEFLSVAPVMILGGLAMIFAGLWTM